jgi:hypothetical protein
VQQPDDPLNKRAQAVQDAVNRYLRAILSGDQKEIEEAFKAWVEVADK